MARFKHLGGLFWRSPSDVLWGGRPTPLDPKSTVLHFNSWATDGRIVFVAGSVRRGIDALTFQPLNYLYAKDNSKVVTIYASVPADASSFAVLDSGQERSVDVVGVHKHEAGYGRDHKSIFYMHIRMKTADPETFSSLGGCYGRDAESVFFEQNKLPKANPQTWHYLCSGYSSDGNRVYFQHQLVKGANAQHFVPLDPLGEHVAYDGERFYQGTATITAGEYAESLVRESESLTNIAGIIASGKWQENRFREDWEFREPDEDRFREKDFTLGEKRESLDDKFGKGSPMTPEEFNREYGAEYPLEIGQKIVRWTRGKHRLMCVLDQDQVVAAIIGNHEPPYVPTNKG